MSARPPVLPVDLQRPDRRGRAAAAVLGLAAAGAVLAGGVPAHAAPQAAPTCTDRWTNTAGGQWDTGSNWSKGSAPTTTDVACLTASGSYTVVIGNETITVAGLVIGGSGSTPTLQIGNGGSNFPHIAVNGTVTVATGSTLNDGWGGTFTATEIDNNGTVLVPSTGYTSSATVTTFQNAGTLSIQGQLDYSMPTSASLLHNTGTITTASGVLLDVSSPSGQTGTFEQGGLVTDLGRLTVADAVIVDGGTVCGSPLTVGQGSGGNGGTLTFASTVASGPACGSGVVTDALFIPNVTATVTGTIPATYSVSIGDGGSNYPHVTLSSVTNRGTLSFGWGGTLTGPLTNVGTFVVPSTGYSSTWSSSGLSNTGTVDVAGPLAVDLANGASVTNSAGAALKTEAGQLLSFASSSGSATVTQAGLITNLGSLSVADALSVTGGTICGNAVYSGSGSGGTGGTLSFAAKPAKGPSCAKKQAKDRIFIPNVTGTISSDIPTGWTVTIGDGGSSYAHVTLTGHTNAGTLAVGFGATLTDTAVLSNTGTLEVTPSGYTTGITLGGLSNAGKVLLEGSATLDLGSGTFTTAAKKSVTVYPVAAVTVNVPLSNAGTLTVQGGGRLSVTQFTQTSTGTYAVTQAAHSEPTYLTVSGAAQVAGTVSVAPVKKFKATSGDQLTLVGAGSRAGTFATVKGTYAIGYGATQVTATAH